MAITRPTGRRTRRRYDVTREEAQRLLASMPEFVPGECPSCGARTVEEASEKCRPYQIPSGDYVCATGDDFPTTHGRIHVVNPQRAELDAYLWEWFAYDEGMTRSEPKWPEHADDPLIFDSTAWTGRTTMRTRSLYLPWVGYLMFGYSWWSQGFAIEFGFWPREAEPGESRWRYWNSFKFRGRKK